MASCLEGIGEPLRVAGWKCQFSRAARHLSSISAPRLWSTTLLVISPRSSMVISMTSFPGEAGNCHGHTLGLGGVVGRAGGNSLPYNEPWGQGAGLAPAWAAGPR